MKRSTATTWNFSLFIMVTFYCVGAAFVEGFLNYPSWYIIGPTEAWFAYRQLLAEKIIPLLAIPALILQLFTNILVIVYRPFVIPKWTGWITLVLLIITIVSSAVVQIPIQMEFDKGYRKELLDELISSSFYLRDVTGIVRALIILYMLYCVVKVNAGTVVPVALKV